VRRRWKDSGSRDPRAPSRKGYESVVDVHNWWKGGKTKSKHIRGRRRVTQKNVSEMERRSPPPEKLSKIQQQGVVFAQTKLGLQPACQQKRAMVQTTVLLQETLTRHPWGAKRRKDRRHFSRGKEEEISPILRPFRTDGKTGTFSLATQEAIV